MSNVDSTAIPFRSKDVREEQIDGELLLYLPHATRAIYLNASAAVIWGLCDGKRSLDEMTSIVADSYPDAGADLKHEVQDTVRQLIAVDVVGLARPN
jgi:coenzyme PQQ synthesis protein D (PqqD)